MKNSHPDILIIACRGEHARIGGVPSHGIHTPTGVSFERFDQGSVLLVPDVDFGICALLFST